MPENVGYVWLPQRPLESQYCYLQQTFLGYAVVKGSNTNTKSQASCFTRFMLMKHQTSNEIAIFRAPFLRYLLVLRIELSKLLFSVLQGLKPTVNFNREFG